MSQNPRCGTATLSFSTAKLALVPAIRMASAARIVFFIAFLPRHSVVSPLPGYCLAGAAETIASASHRSPQRVVENSENSTSIGYLSSTILVRSTPIAEISTSSTSPGFIQSGGLRLWPTPSGVPVAMTSPGCSVVKSEQKLTICWQE